VALEEHTAAHGELPDRSETSSPDREFQKRETSAIVWQALDRLPFDQRAVIVLREIEGLSYEEIATSLEVAVGTVKSRLARARENLREGLGAR
jgi:RNA polymerase sigma-70 factor (ECF subfamily)